MLCGSVGLAGVDKPPVGVCVPLLLPLPPRVGLSGVTAGLLFVLLFELLLLILLLLLLLLPPPHSAFVTRSITEVLPLLPPDEVADCVEEDEDELEPLP